MLQIKRDVAFSDSGTSRPTLLNASSACPEPQQRRLCQTRLLPRLVQFVFDGEMDLDAKDFKLIIIACTRLHRVRAMDQARILAAAFRKTGLQGRHLVHSLTACHNAHQPINRIGRPATDCLRNEPRLRICSHTSRPTRTPTSFYSDHRRFRKSRTMRTTSSRFVSSSQCPPSKRWSSALGRSRR